MDEKFLYSIVREVLRRLTESKAVDVKPVIVLLTGGTLGLKVALEALKKCNQNNFFSFSLVCTSGACNVHDIESIRDDLKADLIVTEAEKKNPLALLHKKEGLLVPVLSRNTMAKTVGHDFDRLGSALILESLMYNIPVVAVRDAADPENREWESLGVCSPAPGLVKSLQIKIKEFEAMGVTVTSSASFQSAIEDRLIAQPWQTARQIYAGMPGAEGAPKALVSAEDVRKVKADQKTTLYFQSPNTIITPLAREVAEELGISLKLQLK